MHGVAAGTDRNTAVPPDEKAMLLESDRMKRWTARVRALKTEIHALSLACRDPRVPWRAKILAMLVVAYALSPIDLIPDCIPVLGYLDDLIILPLGILLVLKMIPNEVVQEYRSRAAHAPPVKKASAAAGAAIVVLLWITMLIGVIVLFRKMTA